MDDWDLLEPHIGNPAGDSNDQPWLCSRKCPVPCQSLAVGQAQSRRYYLHKRQAPLQQPEQRAL
jgi:hypothetical protein